MATRSQCLGLRVCSISGRDSTITSGIISMVTFIAMCGCIIIRDLSPKP